jgi:drug/metabolite transporter (DMT)-like permease
VTRRGWLLFVALSTIWGMPYLFIKIAVADLSPAVVVFGRTLIAAVLLLPLAARRGALRPLLPYWRWVLLFAVVEIAVPFGMLGIAETRLSSSLTALLIAAVPLLGALLARLLRLHDRIDRRRLAGLLVGIAGVAGLVGIDVRGGDGFAVGAVALAAVGYATGPIIASTRLQTLSGLGISAAALALNAVGYAPIAWLTRPTGGPLPGRASASGSVSASAWWAVVVLGVVCSALAFVVFFALVAEVGPTRTTVITYVNPAVAVLLGVAVLSEPVTLGMVVGFPLVIAGSWLATRRAPHAPAGPAVASSTPAVQG